MTELLRVNDGIKGCGVNIGMKNLPRKQAIKREQKIYVNNAAAFKSPERIKSLSTKDLFAPKLS